MGRPRKEELRELKEEERQELKRVVKATSERIDAIKRAKALLAVAAGATLTVAGQETGLSREAVAQMVKRFNQRGLAVLEIAAGRGRQQTYTSEQRARVLTEVQREPDREKDQTATCAPKASSRRPTRCCIPGSKNSSARCSPSSRRSSHEHNCLPKLSALSAHVGRRGWAIHRAIPSLPYASCSCWIIWRGTCRMIWCVGSLIME